MVIEFMEEYLNRRDFFRITDQLMAGSGVFSINPADQTLLERSNDVGITGRVR